MVGCACWACTEAVFRLEEKNAVPAQRHRLGNEGEKRLEPSLCESSSSATGPLEESSTQHDLQIPGSSDPLTARDLARTPLLGSLTVSLAQYADRQIAEFPGYSSPTLPSAPTYRVYPLDVCRDILQAGQDQSNRLR